MVTANAERQGARKLALASLVTSQSPGNYREEAHEQDTRHCSERTGQQSIQDRGSCGVFRRYRIHGAMGQFFIHPGKRPPKRRRDQDILRAKLNPSDQRLRRISQIHMPRHARSGKRKLWFDGGQCSRTPGKGRIAAEGQSGGGDNCSHEKAELLQFDTLHCGETAIWAKSMTIPAALCEMRQRMARSHRGHLP